MSPDRTIVIVGEQPPRDIVEAITSIVSGEGFRISYQPGGLQVLHESVEGIIVYSPNHSLSLEILRFLLSRCPQSVVFVTATGTPESMPGVDLGIQDNRMVRWSNVGSFSEVVRGVIKTLKHRETDRLREKLVKEFGLRQLVGRSSVFQHVLESLPKLASSPSPVLITGDTGTGKEACARAIHYLGQRSGGAFISINCSAIPDHLFENEFFGHKRGAFTDAHFDEPGILAQARGGTLFLDEITSLPLASQAKILRLFEQGSFRPLGGQSSVDVNVRFIAATNLDIRQEVEAGRFRRDVFYRVNVLRIVLPSLRERGGDEIEELARYFIVESAAANDKAPLEMSPDSIAKLRGYHWPGNVRELKCTSSEDFGHLPV
jgi:DNA-binding NtrC family response regulator